MNSRYQCAKRFAAELHPFYIGGGVILLVVLESIPLALVAPLIFYGFAFAYGWFWFE